MKRTTTESERALSYQKFFGNYRGEVVDTADPDENGAVRIRVFGVFDEIPDDMLPWAIFADPFMGGLEGVGSSFIPEKGSHVWVFFENGDHMSPVYFAGAPAMNGEGRPDLPVESRTNGKYASNKVLKTRNGITIEIDDTDGNVEIRVTHPSGTKQVWDVNGNVDHTIPGNYTNDTEGDVVWKAPTFQFGEDGDVEPIVLGDKFRDWVNNELVPWLNSHTHTGNLGAPTSPPSLPMMPGTAAPAGPVYSTKNKSQ